jgi:hypothetical protein
MIRIGYGFKKLNYYFLQEVFYALEKRKNNQKDIITECGTMGCYYVLKK